VFTERQIARILPRALDAIVTSDPDEARTYAEELKIQTITPTEDSRSRLLCAETLRLLSSEAKEGRLHARQIIRQVLLNPANLDESGEMIRSLLKTWREDLVTTLRSVEGIERVSLRGNAIEVTPLSAVREPALKRVKEIIQNETEHTDWLLTVITSRAALYRADLEEIVVALSDFCGQRAECAILLGDPLSKFSKRLGPQPLSTIDEDDFLDEILNGIEDHFRALSREQLPDPVTDIVERQILYPSEAPVYYEQLARLVVENEALRSTYPESESLSAEELSAEIKERAERLMRIIERESRVLYERATYPSQRCAALAHVSPYASSTEAQLARIVAETSDELGFFISDDEAHRLHLERFRDQLHELGGSDPDAWSIDRPHVFTLFIPREDTINGEDLVLVFRLCLKDFEEPEDDFEFDAEEEDVFEGEQRSSFEEQPELGEPLEFQITCLRPQVGDLLAEGEQLALWLARIQSKLTLLSEKSPDSSSDNEDTLDADISEETEAWRYYGLSQARCEELFRPFFRLIATRYPHAWSLIPEDSRGEMTLLDLSVSSPFRQMTDLLQLCEEFYPDIVQFSQTQRDTVQAWLRSYNEWSEPFTMDLLLSLPIWTRASKLFKAGNDSVWRICERESLLEEHEAFLSSKLFSPELHLLLHTASERGMRSMLELLEDGLVCIDGVSEAFVACLNTIPAHELRRRIFHRAKPALEDDSVSSFWEPIPTEHARSSLLALRTHFGGVWADIHRSFTRGLL
jgi:hypothetical protein